MPVSEGSYEKCEELGSIKLKKYPLAKYFWRVVSHKASSKICESRIYQRWYLVAWNLPSYCF